MFFPPRPEIVLTLTVPLTVFYKLHEKQHYINVCLLLRIHSIQLDNSFTRLQFKLDYVTAYFLTFASPGSKKFDSLFYTMKGKSSKFFFLTCRFSRELSSGNNTKRNWWVMFDYDGAVSLAQFFPCLSPPWSWTPVLIPPQTEALHMDCRSFPHYFRRSWKHRSVILTSMVFWKTWRLIKLKILQINLNIHNLQWL